MGRATKASSKKKQVVISNLQEKLSKAKLAVVTEYRGLKVSEIADLRSQLRAVNADYHVTKNTLTRIASKQAGIAALGALLEGPTAIAFCYGDLVAPAKILNEAAHSSKVLKIRGGLMEGKLLTAEDVIAVATLPPREVLIGRAVSTMNMPVVRLVHALAGPLRSLTYVLQARARQLEAR